MRFVYFVLMLVFVAAVGIFAFQNKDEVTMEFLTWKGSFPIAAVVGAVYVLGMFTGWTVVGILRRTFQRATEHRN